MSDLEEKIDQSIDKGINFLRENQFENGQFRSYVSNNDAMLAHGGIPHNYVAEEGVVFPTALIGNSLMFLADDVRVNEMLNKLAGFLLVQRKTGSVWNHYTLDHSAYPLCPFDLDDTACASVFLKKRNIEFPPNDELLVRNISSKKLFYTWITFGTQFSFNKTYWRLVLRELRRPVKSFIFWKILPCERNDVDAVVNANVLYYLPDAPNSKFVVSYLLDIIKNQQEANCDKWYKNVLTIYYFISRVCYSGIIELEPAKQAIKDRTLKKVTQNGQIGDSVLDTALAICTLLNFNYKNKAELIPAIQFIVDQQAKIGSWAKRGFYYDGPLKTACWGSEELTTGLCLEALVRYKNTL